MSKIPRRPIFGDYDPRDHASRDRDDRIRDREDDWLVLGSGAGSASVPDERAEPDTRDGEDDWREKRERDPRDPDDRGSFDPRDVFVRDLEAPGTAIVD